jgi:exonuclease SbcC
MLFKKLTIQNIRSYKDLTIEFPKGSVLLAGNIGSGKTSVLLGLQFALFGLQPGQKGTSILRQGTNNAYACLELDIDGETIILERTIKKSTNGGITQDSNIITIGTERKEMSTSEMKAIIQEKPEVRLDTLRHIFGIDRYKRIKDNSQILFQKIKEAIKIKEVLASELNLMKEKFTFENEKKITIARESNNLNLEYQNLILKKQQAEKKLTSSQSLINEKITLESEFIKTTALIQGKKDLESRMKKEITLMRKQINEKLDFSEERLKAILELLEKHKKILDKKNIEFLKINSQISAFETRKERPLKLKNQITSLENCPTCLQSVGQDHKSRIEKQIQYDMEEINRELEQKIQYKQILIKEIKKEKELLNGYEIDRNNLQQDKIKYEHQKEIEIKIKSDIFILERTSNEIIEFQNQSKQLQTKIQTFTKSQEEFDKAKKEFQEINEITRTKEILMATKNKELELLKARLEELSTEIKSKEKIRKEINHLRELQDWIQEKFITMINLTEKNVMSKLRNNFSTIFAEWFSMLVSDSLSVRLNEDFTPIITNQDYEIDYDFLSGGERTATALAYRLSLNKILNSMLSQIKTKNIVILDEPTDGFATEQIDKMRDIFEQLKAEQTILVSHEEKIEGFVDHVIRIKKDGISKIENQ